MTLLEALRHIRDNGPADDRVGICYNAAALTGLGSKTYQEISTLALKWSKHSGSDAFPVPRPLGYAPLWLGAYGDLRRELLDFLIQELENDSA